MGETPYFFLRNTVFRDLKALLGARGISGAQNGLRMTRGLIRLLKAMGA